MLQIEYYNLQLAMVVTGADLQQQDMDVIRVELAAKKGRLNDLNEEIRALASRYCVRRKCVCFSWFPQSHQGPGECVLLCVFQCRQTDLQTAVDVLDRQMPVTPQDLQAQLDQCSAKLEATLKEVQTVQELRAQDLAAENRARKDHTAACAAHAEAVRLQEALADDESTLHRATREMHLAKEKAEQDLQRAQQQSSQTISDWTTKVKDRTREVDRHVYACHEQIWMLSFFPQKQIY